MYRHLKNDFFKGKHRVMVSLEPTLEEREAEIKESKAYSLVLDILTRNNYEIIDYFDGYCRKLNEDGTPQKNKLKIGRVLSTLKKPRTLEKFKVDPIRASSDLSVIVSRHPMDIAGMTTGRDWPSCMSKDGCNFSYVRRDVQGGTLIAYLVKKNDTNINKPLARILLKRYENSSGVPYYVPAKRAYGINNTYFLNRVQKIANKLNEGVPEGIFKFDDTYYYNDGEKSSIDTRTEDTLRKERERKIRFFLDQQKKHLKNFLEAFEPCNDLLDSGILFQDLSGYLRWQTYLGKLSQDNFDKYNTTRNELIQNGSNLYTRFIFDNIKRYGKSRTENVFSFWKFVSDFKHNAFSFKESLDIFAELDDPYFFCKLSDKAPAINNDDKDKQNLEKTFNYIAKLVAESNCITDYNFEYVFMLNHERNEELEKALVNIPEEKHTLRYNLIRNYALSSTDRKKSIKEDNGDVASKLVSLGKL